MRLRVLWLFVLIPGIAEYLSGQTIAEVARQERARQKQVQGANRRTFSNAEAAAPARPVNPEEAARAGDPATEESPTARPAEPPKPAGPVDNQGRDEKYWRDTFQKARIELTRAEQNVQLIEAGLRDLNTQLLRQSDVYNRENVLGPQITAAQKELDAARIAVEQARNKISNLEEELRSSGGLAGWAR